MYDFPVVSVVVAGALRKIRGKSDPRKCSCRETHSHGQLPATNRDRIVQSVVLSDTQIDSRRTLKIIS